MDENDPNVKQQPGLGEPNLGEPNQAVFTVEPFGAAATEPENAAASEPENAASEPEEAAEGDTENTATEPEQAAEGDPEGTPEDDPENVAEDGSQSEEEAPKRHSRKRRIIEWSAVLVVALVLSVVIRLFIFGAFYIPSNSMEPTLGAGDRILVNKLSYISSGPSHGDLIVFFPPATAPDIEKVELIKRVIATEGDTLEFRGGELFLNGVLTEEEFLPPEELTYDFSQITVQDDHVFVMGDNRSNSRDSRQFGPVPIDNIVGRAFITYWPPSEIGGL